MLITTHTADTNVVSIATVAPRVVTRALPAHAELATMCAGAVRGIPNHADRCANASWLFEQKTFGTKYHSQRERPT